MHTFLIVTGSLVSYLMIVCVVATFTIRVNPFEVDYEGRNFVWFLSLIWPVSVPIGTFIGFCVYLVSPLMVGTAGAMSKIVDWTTKKRVKKSNLPKAKVHK